MGNKDQLLPKGREENTSIVVGGRLLVVSLALLTYCKLCFLHFYLLPTTYFLLLLCSILPSGKIIESDIYFFFPLLKNYAVACTASLPLTKAIKNPDMRFGGSS
jgi:hypothetical protein